MALLNFTNHTRVFDNYTYIYPVVSRRSNGLSLGINLNTNNACNWRCVYCQVENLIRGQPPLIDLIKLERELDAFLQQIIYGDFMSVHVPYPYQRFNDISLSGNGEPTLSQQFGDVIQIIKKLRTKYHLDHSDHPDYSKNTVKTIIITNGSTMHKSDILESLKTLATLNGEIWFKIDRASTEAIMTTNQVHLSPEHIIKNLIKASALCKTYIQTCWYQTNYQDPSSLEVSDYITLISKIKAYIKSVLLYTIRRTPALDEGAMLSPVSLQFLNDIQAQLAQLSIPATCYV